MERLQNNNRKNERFLLINRMELTTTLKFKGIRLLNNLVKMLGKKEKLKNREMKNIRKGKHLGEVILRKTCKFIEILFLMMISLQTREIGCDYELKKI